MLNYYEASVYHIIILLRAIFKNTYIFTKPQISDNIVI